MNPIYIKNRTKSLTKMFLFVFTIIPILNILILLAIIALY